VDSFFSLALTPDSPLAALKDRSGACVCELKG
jgi:hypothetical protein